MRNKSHSTFTRFLCIGLAGLALAATANEDLRIDWYTVDGGGGSISAGEFTLSGTIGQPDAGVLIPYCCGFSLMGGFWSQFIDVNQPDGPRLCIRLTSTNTLLLSWPAYHADYLLQRRPAAVPGWNDVPATPVVVAGENQVSLDELVGWVIEICRHSYISSDCTNLFTDSLGPCITNGFWFVTNVVACPDGFSVTNVDAWGTNVLFFTSGFGWYLYSTSLSGPRCPDCGLPAFYPINEPTFFRLRRQQ